MLLSPPWAILNWYDHRERLNLIPSLSFLFCQRMCLILEKSLSLCVGKGSYFINSKKVEAFTRCITINFWALIMKVHRHLIYLLHLWTMSTCLDFNVFQILYLNNMTITYFWYSSFDNIRFASKSCSWRFLTLGWTALFTSDTLFSLTKLMVSHDLYVQQYTNQLSSINEIYIQPLNSNDRWTSIARRQFPNWKPQMPWLQPNCFELHWL